MMHILLYWNHICILHRFEKTYLERVRLELMKDGIDLEIRYFGLGYAEHMSEYLALPDSELPDIIVSSDLEVFEDGRISARFSSNLYDVSNWMAKRDLPSICNALRGEDLLPILSIPLVYFTRNPENCRNASILEIERLSIGGVNNSAIKTIMKTIWSHYGKHAAEHFLEHCTARDMPIEAFQDVISGKADTALVPTVYALRNDDENTFMVVPKEGAILINSYLAANRKSPEWAARKVVEKIISRELADFYVESGDLIFYPDVTGKHPQTRLDRTAAPTYDWLESYSPEEFYELYTRLLPNARDMMKT